MAPRKLRQLRILVAAILLATAILLFGGPYVGLRVPGSGVLWLWAILLVSSLFLSLTPAARVRRE